MKLHRLLVGVCLCACLTACGPSNNVRLLPRPVQDTAVLPSPNAPRITVVTFADKRSDKTVIGSRRDKSAFVTMDNVPHWISKALADELSRSALQISFASSVAEARKGNPDYLVTGSVDDVSLKELSATELSASLRVQYVLANRQARVLRESPSASQVRSGLPSSSAADAVMLDTLMDLVKPMARKIVTTVDAKK